MSNANTERKIEIENYIKENNVAAIRSLLDAGMAPREEILFVATYKGSEFECNTNLLNLACLHDKLDIVKVLVEYGLDLNPAGESLLYVPLTWQRAAIFSYLVECGASIEKSKEEVERLFLWLEKCDFSQIQEAVKKLELPLANGGNMLRSAASKGNLPMVQYLLSEGIDINYHKSNMVFPYASTAIIEAARADRMEMVQYLAEQGADILIEDKYGDRPYTLAVKNKNAEMVEFLKKLEPEDLHSELEKAKKLKSYKLPQSLSNYLKTGPLLLEFPNGRSLKWVKLYSYIDTVEMKWKRKKLLSIMEELDQYSDVLLVWSPKEEKICFIDVEHEQFQPVCTWEEFIADPEGYLHGMVEGKYHS